MYRKVHLRLTALCAGITTAIMIIMSLGYLYVSETALYENQYNSFKNDMNTITTNLEQQPVISMEWISKMESQNNYTFFCWIMVFHFYITSLMTPMNLTKMIFLMNASMPTIACLKLNRYNRPHIAHIIRNFNLHLLL